MFNKPTSPATPSRDEDPSLDVAPRPAADSARRGPRAASLISSDMRIEGSVSCEGELQIDGVVKGDVKVARLTIGEQGQIEGGITAESVDCRGRVNGSINAKQVRLHAQSHIDGDISHEQLAMEPGAFFQGRSLRLKRPAEAPRPAPSAPASSGLAAPKPPEGNGASTAP